MIKTISIHRHKSFHPTTPYPVRLDPSKSATYIYGLNGAGKSAIGEVVYAISRNDPDFGHCKIETTDGAKYRYLVYNQAFIDRVISEPIKGIFTVGEVDGIRQKRIEEIVADVAKLDGLIVQDDKLVHEAAQQVGKEEARAKDEIWKAHELGKKTQLAHLLKGYGRDAPLFFQELRTHELPADGQLDSLARLEQRWADVSSAESERTRVSIDTSGLARIEGDPIWGEVVEVSTTSRLAPLVAEWGNADWVARGQPYLKSDTCPFCQQGVPHDFRGELSRLLEGERKAKVDKIGALVDSYSAQIEVLEARVQTILADPQANEVGLDLAWAEVRRVIQSNLNLMRQKAELPSSAVPIALSSTIDLGVALAKINALVDDFNTRIRDRDSERKRIRKMFFQVLHTDRVDAYARHDAAIGPLRAAETQAAEDRKSRNEQRTALDNELRDLRRLQKGVDASIDAINDRFSSLGITAFSIQRKNDEERLYCLHRPGVPDCSPLSLSEGEKTLIAFLYFMETLKGSHDEDESIDPKMTIAVIDDPISSLSQNYVYDIATMIHRELAKHEDRPQKCKQVIVLTHNLFFFHELVRQQTRKLEKAHQKCGMLRVVKNEYSEVQTLDPTKLMNDYDVWWHLLKDARSGKVPTQIVPNAMRCILEQFFTFTTGASDFPEAVKQLADKDTSSKYTALDRFVDRGSHKDGINGPPIDWTEYDVEYLLGKLRAMFFAIGQEQHYLMKMGELPQETPPEEIAAA